MWLSKRRKLCYYINSQAYDSGSLSTVSPVASSFLSLSLLILKMLIATLKVAVKMNT